MGGYFLLDFLPLIWADDVILRLAHRYSGHTGVGFGPQHALVISPFLFNIPFTIVNSNIPILKFFRTDISKLTMTWVYHRRIWK